jgi:hypothetical protein
MANMTIEQYGAAATIDGTNDLLLLYQNSSGTYKSINRSTLLSVSGTPADISTTQTFTNKTLTSPTIASPTLSGTITGTYIIGGTPTFPASVVTLTGSQTLTNKTLTSPTINTGTISNPTLTVDSISGYTTSTVVTVGGVQMSNGVLNTSGAVTSTSVAAGGIIPNALASGAGTGWAWQSYTPSYTNLAVGTGGGATNTGFYTQIGKTVFVETTAVLGTSGESVSGSVSFTLPVTASSHYNFASTALYGIGWVSMIVAGSYFYGIILLGSTSTVTINALNSNSTYLGPSAISSTVPGTWAAGSIMTCQLYYECA